MSSILPAPPPDIQMRSGACVWFLHPARTRVLMEDLVIHLERICRYQGTILVNDLQHSVFTAELARLWEMGGCLRAYAAAHDLHEAYIGDLVTPMKDLLPGWGVLENAWMTHVHLELGLAWPPRSRVRSVVKVLDQRALVAEMTLLGHPAVERVRQETGMRSTDAELLMLRTVMAASTPTLARCLEQAIEGGRGRNVYGDVLSRADAFLALPEARKAS